MWNSAGHAGPQPTVYVTRLGRVRESKLMPPLTPDNTKEKGVRVGGGLEVNGQKTMQINMHVHPDNSPVGAIKPLQKKRSQQDGVIKRVPVKPQRNKCQVNFSTSAEGENFFAVFQLFVSTQVFLYAR